jgi:hypothetical protein
VVELVGTTVFTISDVSRKDWANISLASIRFPVHERSRLSVYGAFNVYDTPSDAVLDTIFPEKALSLLLTTHVTIQFRGMILYRHLPLFAQYDITLPYTLQEKFDEVFSHPKFPIATESANHSIDTKTPATTHSNRTTFEIIAASNSKRSFFSKYFRVNTSISAFSPVPGTTYTMIKACSSVSAVYRIFVSLVQ